MNFTYPAALFWDAMQVSRRKFAGSIVGAVSIGGLAAVTNRGITTASAASVSGDFQIPEVNKEITTQVQSLTLTVTGTAAWQATTDPTKAFIRLKVAPEGGEFEQLDSYVFSALARDYEGDYSFHDLSLFEHSEITESDVNPGSIGRTKTLTLQARLTLVVKTDGRELASDTIEERVPVGVTLTRGGADVQLGATGEIKVSEETT